MFMKFLQPFLCVGLIMGTALPAAAQSAPSQGHFDGGGGRGGYHRYDEDRWERRHGYRHERRHERREREWRHERRRQARRYHRDDNDDAGNIIAGAIIGLAAGAIVSQAARSEPRVIYREAPSYGAPGSLEPWTPEWHRWCSDRYRSFDPRTGFWRGYDGKTYFCRP